MMTRDFFKKVSLFLAFGLGIGGSCLTAEASCGAPAPDQFPAPPAPFTHVAKQVDAGWHRPSTWEGGEVPGDDAIVYIPCGAYIRIARQQPANHRFLYVDGTLGMIVRQNTRLLTETLYIDHEGAIVVGLESPRVLADKTAEIVFTGAGDIDLSWDPMQRSRGLFSNGKVDLNGAVKLPYATLSSDANATTLTLSLDQDVEAGGWQIGDEIVITGTYFRQGEETREERRTLVSVTNATVQLDQPLTFDHIRPRGDLSLHVANLTRNVILRSQTPVASEAPFVKERGHVMLRNPDVEIRSVVFLDLGRTDKSIPLDDTVPENTGTPSQPVYTGRVSAPLPADIENRRGRYSLHFHKNGIQPLASTPPSTVHDSVVIGTPGWGFVNHSSHVDFQRNIAFDFRGAGFVTESGDELGNFIDNLAIRGGSKDGPYPETRIVFENSTRPQPLSDFGFLGEGFWFQGPAVRVRGNIANGCHGAGMTWFTTGAPEIDFIDPVDQRNRYVGFPNSALNPVYGGLPDFSSFEGRHWLHAPNQLVIADLPILECDDFESYANFQGFRLRFNNMDSNAWYSEFDYELDILAAPNHPTSPFAERMRQQVSNLKLWNNQRGFRARYISRTDFDDVDAINRLSFKSSALQPGCEVNFEVYETTATQIKVDGYAIACWLNRGPNGGTPIPFPNGIGAEGQYSNYAAAEKWFFPLNVDPCPLVLSATPSAITSTSVTLTPNLQLASGFNVSPERFLVRYWRSGEDTVEFQQFDGVSQGPLLITGLDNGTSYKFQVLAGCAESAGLFWSAKATATTQP